MSGVPDDAQLFVPRYAVRAYAGVMASGQVRLPTLPTIALKSQSMELGLVLPQTVGATWERAARTASVAEEAGFDSLWVIDHVYGFPPEGGILEAWTMLSALAATTKRVGLGAQVFCQSFRNPALLAKMGSTLQEISGGRLHFLIGAGWFGQEYEAFGYRFPPAGERFAQLRETVRILRGLWESNGEPFTYTGKYYSVEEAMNRPAPPHPISIGIGGSGPRVLDLIAAEADEWNCPAAVLHEYDNLKRMIDERSAHHGRSVRRTAQIVFAPGDDEPPDSLVFFNPHLGLRGSKQQMIDRVGELSNAGLTGLFGMPAGRGALERVAEILPELQKL
jgi:alkanesulfonate monooxygenase SsuD/methylene tetrahydromethanopterin reductase-like flavin-dependent oxidoreductase (luciferase family)